MRLLCFFSTSVASTLFLKGLGERARRVLSIGVGGVVVAAIMRAQRARENSNNSDKLPCQFWPKNTDSDKLQ